MDQPGDPPVGDAAARAGDADLTVLGPNQPTEAGGIAVAEQVVRAGVTAVLAYNDLMAIGLIEGLDTPGPPGARRTSASSASTTSR